MMVVGGCIIRPILLQFRHFLLTLQPVRFSTSYHNKAICRRILSYMPSSGGHFLLTFRTIQEIYRAVYRVVYRAVYLNLHLPLACN